MHGFRTISSDEQRALLQSARFAASRALGLAAEGPVHPAILGSFGGAFVTYYNTRRLRGCVGAFMTTDDIKALVCQVAVASLTDSRFLREAITIQELPVLDIEVSLVSEPTPTDDPLALIPGVHGIRIEAGGRSGCFLPKVAVEQRWSPEEYLGRCCAMKVGLPSDAWRRPDVRVLLFTAQVFRDADFGMLPTTYHQDTKTPRDSL